MSDCCDKHFYDTGSGAYPSSFANSFPSLPTDGPTRIPKDSAFRWQKYSRLLAIDSAGHLWSRGSFPGDGTVASNSADSDRWRKISSENWLDVHSCWTPDSVYYALRADGALYCWGGPPDGSGGMGLGYKAAYSVWPARDDPRALLSSSIERAYVISGVLSSSDFQLISEQDWAAPVVEKHRPDDPGSGAAFSVTLHYGFTSVYRALAGSGYTREPEVVVSDSGAVIEPASLSFDMRYSVDAVIAETQTAPYRGPVAVVFPPGLSGNTAAASCTLDENGFISSVTVTNGGEYASAPTARFVGTGGNASARVVLNGSVFGVSVRSSGRYTSRSVSLSLSPPQLPGGVQATLNVNKGVIVHDVQVTSGGSGYTSPTDLGLTLYVKSRLIARLSLSPSGVVSIKHPTATWSEPPDRNIIPAMSQVGVVRIHSPSIWDAVPLEVRSPTRGLFPNISFEGQRYDENTPLEASYELRFAGGSRDPVSLIRQGDRLICPIDVVDFTSEPYVVAIIPETVRRFGLRPDVQSPDEYVNSGVVGVVAPADMIGRTPFWCGPGVSAEPTEWSHGCWEVSGDKLLGGDILVAKPLSEGDYIPTKSRFAGGPIVGSNYTTAHIAASRQNAPSGWASLEAPSVGTIYQPTRAWHDFTFIQTVPRHEVVLGFGDPYGFHNYARAYRIPERREVSAVLDGNESSTRPAAIQATLSSDEMTLSVSVIDPGEGYRAEPKVVITAAVLTPQLIGTGFTSIAGSISPGLAAVKNGVVYACGINPESSGAFGSSTLKPVGKSIAVYDHDRNLPSAFGGTIWRETYLQGYNLSGAFSGDNALIDYVTSLMSSQRPDVFGRDFSATPDYATPSDVASSYGGYGSVVTARDQPGQPFSAYEAPAVFAYPKTTYELGAPLAVPLTASGQLSTAQYIEHTLFLSAPLVFNSWLTLYGVSSNSGYNPKGDYLIPDGYPAFVIKAPYFLELPEVSPLGLTCELIGPSVAVRVLPDVRTPGSYLVEDANGMTWSLFSSLRGHSALTQEMPLRRATIVTSTARNRSYYFVPSATRTLSWELRRFDTGAVCGSSVSTSHGARFNASLSSSFSTSEFDVLHSTAVLFFIPEPGFFQHRQEQSNNSVTPGSLPALLISPSGDVTLPSTSPFARLSDSYTVIEATGPYTVENPPFGFVCPANLNGFWFPDSSDYEPAPGIQSRSTCPVLLNCEYSGFLVPGEVVLVDIEGKPAGTVHSTTTTRSVAPVQYGELSNYNCTSSLYGTIEQYPVAIWRPPPLPEGWWFFGAGFGERPYLPLPPGPITITTPTGQPYPCNPWFLTSPLVGPLNNLSYSAAIAKHGGLLAFDSQGKFLSRYGQPIDAPFEADMSRRGVGAGVTKSGSVWTAGARGPSTVTSVDISVTRHGKNYDLIPYYDVTPPAGAEVARANAEFDGKVIAVAVESEGRGFSHAPSVSFSGGNGNGAEATAVIEGGVARLVVNSPGEGYFIPPSLRFTGVGIPATGRCSVDSAGRIVSAAVQSPGVYRSSPSVEIVPRRWLAAIDVTSGGSGYSSPPTVVVCGAGQGASAFSRIDGRVVSVEVVLGGSGYSPDDPPTVIFSPQDGASPASAQAVVDPETGAIVSITISDGGGFYQSTPSVIVQSQQGGGALLAANISGQVVSVFVTQKGEDYGPETVALFQGGGGAGAAASAVTEPVGSGGSIAAVIDGGVKYIRVTDAGSSYDFPPEVIISGGGNQEASEAASKFLSGEISREEYESSPSVCVAKAVVEGSVSSISVTSGGDGYVAGSLGGITKSPVFYVSDSLGNDSTVTLGAPGMPGGPAFSNGAGTSMKFRRKPRVYAPDDIRVEMSRETFSWTSGASVVDAEPLSVRQVATSHSGLAISRSHWEGDASSFTKCCVTVIDGKTIQSAVLRRGDSQAIASGVRVDLESMVQFSQPPTIVLRDAAGSGAVVQSEINSNGEITGASFSAQGSGYTSKCYLEITSASVVFDQCQATAIVADDGSVSHVAILNSGNGYNNPVAVAHDGKGNGCVLAAHLESGVGPRGIASIEVISSGVGFDASSPPAVFVYDSNPDFINSELCRTFNAHLKRNGRLAVSFASATAEYIDRSSPHAWELWQLKPSDSMSTSSGWFLRLNQNTTRAVATIRLSGIESLTARRAGRPAHGTVAAAHAGEDIQSVSESSSSGCRPHQPAEYEVNDVDWRTASLLPSAYSVSFGYYYDGVTVADRQN